MMSRQTAVGTDASESGIPQAIKNPSRTSPGSHDVRDEVRQAFTLAEVLVVIAVMALLLAILLPSISKARQRARRMSCAANVKAVGDAFNLARNGAGHYPPRDPQRKDPENLVQLANITEAVARKLVTKGTLGKPEPLYCPSSLKNDPHANPPYIRSPRGGRVVNHWETGQISHIYLAGVVNRFKEANGQPTFDPRRESPGIGRDSRKVLTGDRTVELGPKQRNVVGSNHGREGGWFYFTTGDAQWWPWERLTAHPTNVYIWYWPRISAPPSPE